MNLNEHEYLNLINFVLDNGKLSENRTGIDTVSYFGYSCRYDLQDSFPLLTTKKMYWKGIACELLWMLSGDTNVKYLNDNNVHIWDGNAKDFAEKNNIEYGELGPVYGYQWRNFNGSGVDQIKDLIYNLKNNPNSRRHIVSSWNPQQLDQMALPPCHVLFQFNVYDNYLDCAMYQRSADIFLGVPFNVAFYSLLTHIIAHICGLKPRSFFHSIGDAHIYVNHMSQINEQLAREPFDGPSLKIKNDVSLERIDKKEVLFSDFELIDYKCHPALKAEMAV